jgi:hypothetical protein
MIFKNKVQVAAVCAALAFVWGGCEYPYSPVRQAQPGVPTTGMLRSINAELQTCNPSVSQDTSNFPACMLFLNLGEGELSVKVPPAWSSAYPLTGITQHDRLTIVDTGNTVKWFMKKPTFISKEFQDPEWSTHPDYIAVLGVRDDRLTGRPVKADNWSSAYAVKISTKQMLRLFNDSLQAFSTPHLWLPDAAPAASIDYTATATLFNETFVYNGDSSGAVDKATIQSFFGTTSVKVVYNFYSSAGRTGTSIYFIDYSQSTPVVTELRKPGGREDWTCESPLISPDGEWVVYNCMAPDGQTWASYVQKLDATSEAIMVCAQASDPHWFKYPDGSFGIVYDDKKWNPINAVPDKFIEDNMDGKLGSTYLLSAGDLSTLLPGALPAVNFRNGATVLLRLPFQGGYSRDGRFLVTGYRKAYIYMF